MRSDIDPLLQRLRELPDAAAPPYEFSEFSHRYSRRRIRQTQRPARLMAVALAVVVAGWVMKHGLAPWVGAVSTVANAPVFQDHRVSDDPEVDAQSWLDTHPPRALVRVPTQMAVTELEDQIATMDDQLNAVRLSQRPAPQLALLQRDRAQMVESLAQVRYAQNLMPGLP